MPLVVRTVPKSIVKFCLKDRHGGQQNKSLEVLEQSSITLKNLIWRFCFNENNSFLNQIWISFMSMTNFYKSYRQWQKDINQYAGVQSEQWPVQLTSCLSNRDPLKVLSDTKLILNDQGGCHTNSGSILATFRGSLIHKQETGGALEWTVFWQDSMKLVNLLQHNLYHQLYRHGMLTNGCRSWSSNWALLCQN